MSFSAVLTLIFTVFRVASFANETDQKRLVNRIFENYDKRLRPIANTADCVNVTLNPALVSIIDTNEASESITISQWFRMVWHDIFITWNPNDFGGMKQLLIPISEIWYPDIYVDLIAIDIPIPDEKNYAIISFDGIVEISIVQVVTFQCKYDIIMFPFDTQICFTKTGSWMHTANQIDMWAKEPTDLNSYYNNSEWDLLSMTAHRKYETFGASDDAFVTVRYDMVIQRKPSYYILTFVLPCFVITTISIIGIFAPFNDAGDREEKVTMALTTLLTMTVVVTLIADQMPKSGDGLPLLGAYIMLQIGIAAVTALLTVLIMYQNRKWVYGEPIPVWIMKLTRFDNKISHLSVKDSKHPFSASFCKADKTINDVGTSDTTDPMKQIVIVIKEVREMVGQAVEHIHDRNEEEQLRKNWQHVSQRLDLILMIIFIFLSCIFTAAFLLIGYSNLRI